MGKYTEIINRLNIEFDYHKIFSHAFSYEPFTYEYGDGETTITFADTNIYFEHENEKTDLSVEQVYDICKKQAINYLKIMDLMYKKIIIANDYIDKLKNLNDIIDNNKKNLDCAFNQWTQDPN